MAAFQETPEELFLPQFLRHFVISDTIIFHGRFTFIFRPTASKASLRREGK